MNDSGDILSLLGIPREKVAFIDGFHVDEKEDKIVIAETNNDNIQTLVDVSYGLGNFERSRNRILYINRKK